MTTTAARDWLSLPPEEAAALLTRDAGEQWAREFLRHLERRMGEDPLERVMRAWDLSAAQLALVFGVSRQAVAKWRVHGVPVDRAVALADLAAATDVLERYVRRDRIPAVVRRPAKLTGGVSLLELAERGDTDAVRRSVATMFDLRRVQP